MKNRLKNKTTRNNFITYGVVILIYIVMQILTASGSISSTMQGLLVPICAYVVMAISLNLTVGILGELSLGHAGFMSVGAFTGVTAAMALSGRVSSGIVCLIVGMVVGAVFAAIVGFLIGIPVLRLKGDYFLITCLGFGECVRVLFNYTKNITGGSAGYPGIPAYSNALFSLVCVVLAFFAAWRFIHSKYGRNLTSIRENEMAAEAVGINAFRVKRMSFVFSAIYAGWAGALYGGYLMYIVPSSFNLAKSCELITTTVIGGLGSLTGSVLGAIIVTVLPEIFRSLANYRMLLYGMAVVLIILFKPSGLYGYKEFSLKRTINWFRTLPARLSGRKQAETTEKGGR